MTAKPTPSNRTVIILRESTGQAILNDLIKVGALVLAGWIGQEMNSTILTVICTILMLIFLITLPTKVRLEKTPIQAQMLIASLIAQEKTRHER